MKTGSKITAVLQVTDVGSVYEGGGDDSRRGKRWWGELTDLDDGLHAEEWAVSKARCPEGVHTRQTGWWYRSPGTEMLAED